MKGFDPLQMLTNIYIYFLNIFLQIYIFGLILKNIFFGGGRKFNVNVTLNFLME